MAKRKTSGPTNVSSLPEVGEGAGGVQYVPISDETRRRYLNYALSVITSRVCRTSAMVSSLCSDESCT
ncbi:MAG UNVERIFIED_CONTAM: hypothetical protein LVR18_50315 [Planctomycetaceae bacterium]